MEHAFDELIELAGDDRILSKDVRQMKELVAEQRADNCWDFARRSGHRLSGIKNERII